MYIGFEFLHITMRGKSISHSRSTGEKRFPVVDSSAEIWHKGELMSIPRSASTTVETFKERNAAGYFI